MFTFICVYTAYLYTVVGPNYQYERDLFGITIRDALNGSLPNGTIVVRNRLWAQFPKTIYAKKEGILK